MTRIRYAALAALALTLFACSKPRTAETAAQPGQEPVMSSADGLPEGDPAFVIGHGISLWTKDGGKVVYAKASTIADKVVITGEAEKLLYKDEKEARDYYPVALADGTRCYIRSSYVAKAASLAVVRSEKCVQYNEPRVVGATTTIVPRLTIVAVLGAEMVDGFIKVSYVRPDNYLVADKWINRDAIVTGDSDIQAAVAFDVLSRIAEKDKDLKINILQGAVASYGDSAFIDDLNNELLRLTGGAVAAELPVVEEVAAYTVNSPVVNVRAAPSLDAADLGQLKQGDVVEVTERTVAQSEIKGLTDHWYHIVSPLDGWVFGALLDK